MSTQPAPNPNNKEIQPIYNNEIANYQPYSLNAIEFNDINLISRKVLQNTPPSLIIENDDSSTLRKDIQDHEGEKNEEDKDQQEAPLLIRPYPQRLETKQPNLPTSIILDELKNIFVNIPLLQAIKDIPIYNKFIKDSCMKDPRRKKKDPPTINVMGTLADFMLGKHTNPKYYDLGIPIVYVHINKTLIPITLIDLGVTINVMTKTTMLKLNFNLV